MFKEKICIFAHTDPPRLTVHLNDNVIHTKTEMNVLGVIFDSQLQWSAHVTNAINKSKGALHAIKQIKPYFNIELLKKLLQTSIQ